MIDQDIVDQSTVCMCTGSDDGPVLRGRLVFDDKEQSGSDEAVGIP